MSTTVSDNNTDDIHQDDIVTTSSSYQTKTIKNTENGNQNEEIQEEIMKTSTRSSMKKSNMKIENNGNMTTKTTTTTSNYNDDLKIMGQLKNIEKINEKRRVFLQNTINEENKSNGNARKNEKRVYLCEEHEEHEEESFEHIGNEFIDSSYETVQLRTPTSPPPKPPLLIRTSLTSPPSTPILINKGNPINDETTLSNGSNTPLTPMSPVSSLSATSSIMPLDATTRTTPIKPARPTSLQSPDITRTTITTRIVPEPSTVTTIQLKEENIPALQEHVTPIEKETNEANVKHISTNHYDRLIEELKCPGCAHPMKSPILLCTTGHSICEQCTRILMMCPLCRQPFTQQRSRTVEALCSKAHFRCTYASGGCNIRLQVELLQWHQKQCIYKPMKCFMGRVWGDCQWTGRETDWKDHLEAVHINKVFRDDTKQLIWNMAIKQKSLTGYYVFQVFDEMFNFYEIHDKDRILFTTACTSTVKEKKYQYAFEVSLIHPDNEALAITQKFPVHSEYDKDILAEGTCVSIALNDVAKFIDDDKLLHYRISIVPIRTPRKCKVLDAKPIEELPIDFQQIDFEGGNLKSVPTEIIVTRKVETPSGDNISMPSSNGFISSADEIQKVARDYNKNISQSNNDDGAESDPELEAFIAKRWGTPQLHFNRKFLKPPSNSSTSELDDSHLELKNKDAISKMDKKYLPDDESICSTNTSYKKKMTNTLRKSFRALKTDLIEMKPFGKKSAEKKAIKIAENDKQ